MLEIENLNVYYDEFQVLKNVSMSIAEGDLQVLLGPNGHGKSTLLKCICGLLKPSSGSIRFCNQEIGHLSTDKIVELGVVYMAEDRELFPEMTVLENLLMGAYSRNARQKKKENLEYVLSLFPKLDDCKEQLASTLSGGEARLLTIGRGLMSNPKFLAIDEPSQGLAPILRADVFNKIKEIHAKGISILLVEQNIPQLLDVADKTYLLEEGEIVFAGNKDQVLSDKYIKKTFFGM